MDLLSLILYYLGLVKHKIIMPCLFRMTLIGVPEERCTGSPFTEG
jgi:hypothetical protein